MESIEYNNCNTFHTVHNKLYFQLIYETDKLGFHRMW